MNGFNITNRNNIPIISLLIFLYNLYLSKIKGIIKSQILKDILPISINSNVFLFNIFFSDRSGKSNLTHIITTNDISNRCITKLVSICAKGVITFRAFFICL